MNKEQAVQVLKDHFEGCADEDEDFEFWLEQSADYVETDSFLAEKARGVQLDEVDEAWLVYVLEA